MFRKIKKSFQLIAIIMFGILMVATVVGFARKSSERVFAAGPIPPPEGYPKLSLSTKSVTPTLVNTDGAVLEYNIEIINTGAYSASDVTFSDIIPNYTTFTGDVWSSSPPTPVFTDGMILWEHGEVGFDQSVEITFSVAITPGYAGIITNTAVISDPMIAEPVILTAEARATDAPLFEISKSATPGKPGKNQPLTYELLVTNIGQDAVDTPINVTDFIPTDTTFINGSPGFYYDAAGNAVLWEQDVNLDFGESTTYTFTVQIGDVPSGTVIENNQYLVMSDGEFDTGEPYTTTVIDPIFLLSKGIYPDPPGANREITYTLTVLNLGSKATGLVITDVVPPEVAYRRGGEYSDGTVTWYLPSLDTRESAQVTFTGYISDVAGITILNEDYIVCSNEGACAAGTPVPSLLVGPTFEVTAEVDPIAKGTGGGNKPVTPTLTIRNIGPGNALDATALLSFGRISVSNVDVLQVIPPTGTLEIGPDCNFSYPCNNFLWTGNIAVGDVITITTYEGQNTIGGNEGTHYTATVSVTDDLSGYVTEPITATAIGHVTHFANLIPTKTAPPFIAPGQAMTYTIQVFDSAFTTEMDPPPVLTETVPASLTLLSVSDNGTWETVGDETVITWELPAMGPGDYLFRSFSVMTDESLVSGTQIVNDDYRATWYEQEISGTMSTLGEPVTTTVREVGLVDSYKTVTPRLAPPGTGTVLTYVLHVVNSGPYEMNGVRLTDIFPWQNTTYQRDAVASSGMLDSDIVSLEWLGDVAPFSEELITFTAVVDDYFSGVITNTASITHTSLQEEKTVTAVAYITDKPVLRISKVATPDPVKGYGTLLYQIKVVNLGQQATSLVVTDTIPMNTVYVIDSASSGGQLLDGVLTWELPVLNPGETTLLTFQVKIVQGNEVVNGVYAVSCAEGVTAFGEPVITRVWYPMRTVLLPLAFKVSTAR